MPELFSSPEKGKRLFLQRDRCSGCGYCIEVCSYNYLLEAIKELSRTCKGCNRCVEACGYGILEVSGEMNARLAYPPKVKEGAECYFCQSCEYVCPNQAIYVLEAK
jgi:2-oxoglutarate ferredoxin oxidoreductase subunit delta